jgi:hypothetical protein
MQQAPFATRLCLNFIHNNQIIPLVMIKLEAISKICKTQKIRQLADDIS